MTYRWRDGDQNVVSNIRERWPDLTADWTDIQLAALYSDFSLSEDQGNNDEKFPEGLEGGPPND
jgi:hypothetical protein